MTHLPLLSVHNLTIKYDQALALEDVSFALEKGEYVGLIGPNGAGKSTLLQAIVGLVQPTSGQIEAPPQDRIGYVPQQFTGRGSVALSVEEVLKMGQARVGWSRPDGQALAERLQVVGLEADFLHRNFNALSGGQKQRVIIARSLVHDPQLLLFDEPLSGVDYQTKLRIYDLLSELNQKLGLSILFVSHEVEHITSQCHRILCLNKHLHEGCHPMDFAKGKITPYQTEDGAPLTLIHHHHHASC